MLKAALLSALAFGCFLSASAQDLVIFGDSLSDSGYGPKQIQRVLNTNQVYPAPPYWQGRYSDGPVWTESVAATLGANLYNYACGGASSGATPAASSPILPPFANLTSPRQYQAPNFAQQIQLFLEETPGGRANPDAVYVVAFGANDLLVILRGSNATVEDVADFISEGIDELYEAGARKFVIAANARLFAPAFTTARELSATQTLSTILFEALAGQVAALPSRHSGSSAQLFSFAGALLEVYGTATTLGITNTSSCYVPVLTSIDGNKTFFNNEAQQTGSICQDPKSHAFFDFYHPSSTVHLGVARAFLRDVAPAFWPAAAPSPFESASSGVPNAALSPSSVAG